MKIAWIIERMDVARGGREISSAQVAQGLADAGHQVTILCQKGSWQGSGVEVRQIPRRGLRRATRLRNFAADVRQAAIDGRYDVVHATLPIPGCNVYQPRGGTVPAQRAAGLRRRNALSAWVCGVTQPLNRFRQAMAVLEQEVVANPQTLCLAVSQMAAEEFQTYYGRSQGVRVVYNAVDVPDPADERRAEWRQELRGKMRLDDADVVFLSIATNFELKGIREAILAFGRWHRRNRRKIDGRLIVVGRDWPETYQQWVGQQDLGKRVAFIPPTDEIFRWYAAADVCVLLSWYDPCSRVVLEATRWGIPSITTAYNGAAEVLTDGAGCVVDSPSKKKAIDAAMDKLADPNARAACVAACREKDGYLGIDRHVEELLAAYAEVTRSP